MLDAQGVVVKQGGGEVLEDLADYFPVGWAEVSAEGLAARKEQLVCNYVRECTQDVGMQLDLAKGRLYIICMGDDVEGRGVCPKSVDSGEDLFFGVAKEARLFQPQ